MRFQNRPATDKSADGIVATGLSIPNSIGNEGTVGEVLNLEGARIQDGGGAGDVEWNTGNDVGGSGIVPSRLVVVIDDLHDVCRTIGETGRQI